MSAVTDFINFYRQCYRADNRDLSIWNVFNIENHHWLDDKDEELATGHMPRIPIPHKKGEVLFKNRKLYIREKNLVYGILFITGKLRGLSGFVSQRTICSPLIYFDAEIEFDNDHYYFSIDLNNPHLNTPLLTEIVTNESDEPSLDDFPLITGAIDNLMLGSLIAWLNNKSIVSDTLELVRFPILKNKKESQASINRQTSLCALPSAALVLVDRPRSSRGILHELKSLSLDDNYSLPLKALFTRIETTASGKPIDIDNIPGLLSQSQVKALDIASHDVLGLVSGPPGTGKSYTIAAIALDRLLQGERVLIVSETDQSIDVINEKLATDFNAKNVVLRAGTKSFLKKLKKLLDNWLKFGVDPVNHHQVKLLHKRLKTSKKQAVKQEKKFIKRARQSIKWGAALANIKHKLKPSLIDGMRQSYIAWRISHSHLHWAQIDELQFLLKKRDDDAISYLNLYMAQCIDHLLNKNRRELSKFNQAIRARSSQKQLMLHNEIDYELLFKAFPVWLVSLDILHHVLPLKKELFDLVIIDEATQCNIASVIPALQRAKRALIVGDSKQLKHVSFLPYKKEQDLFLNCGLDGQGYESYSYRRNSILDLVSNAIEKQGAVVMLDEHYRSKPDLIAFSNQRFYDSRLKIMQHRPDEYMKGNIVVKKINGKRDKKGINRVEAQAVIDHVIDMINQYTRQLSKPSIGILSPYREQVNYLQKQLIKRVPISDIENHAIRAATPYGFQGDEKDYILLSVSIDDDSKRAAAYLNREDMFNVAITRARQGKTIFISANHRLLPAQNLFRKYMESFDHFDKTRLPVSKEFDRFQNEVCEALNEHGITTWKSYPVANRNVDILCSRDGKSISIDLIGFPGEYANFYEMTTYYLFIRAGLDVFPLSYGIWLMDKDTCIDAINSKLH